jgi:dsDNA-binding SOS-regulon protein
LGNVFGFFSRFGCEKWYGMWERCYQEETVTFCPNCGAPATPETRFCPKCGTTIAAPAEPAAPPQTPYRPPTQIEVPPPQAAYHAPTQMDVPPPGGGYSYQPQQPPAYPPSYAPQASPPPPPQGAMYPPPPAAPPGYAAPRKRSKAPLALLGVVLLGAVGFGVWAYVTHHWPFASSPKDAVERAHAAYQKKDAATFDKYVDLQSVLSDFFDQTAAGGAMDQKTLAQVKFAMPQITEIFKNIFFGTPTTAPAEMVQSMTPGAELMRTGLQKLSYQGVDGEPQITGKDAIVKVKILDSSETPAKTKTLELKLFDNGTNWRVVAALNLKNLDPSIVNPQAGAGGPKEAVDQARAAYAKKDVALFDKYVDLDSVISDYFDQMAAAGSMDAAAVAQVKATLPTISEVVKSIFFGTPTSAPPEVVQTMTASSETLRTALQKVSFGGITDQQVNGSEALLKVKLLDASNPSAKPATMELKLKDTGPNWKIVAVPNLSTMDKQ